MTNRTSITAAIRCFLQRSGRLAATTGFAMLASLAGAQPIELPPRMGETAVVQDAIQDAVQPTAALLIRSADQLRGRRTVSARIRQQIRMFGQNLAGSGTYEHANVNAEYLYRLQFQIALKDQPATMLQVCDGHFLWTNRTYPGEPATTDRVDLNLVRRYLQADEGRAGGAMLANQSAPTLMNMGGLPQLLEMLARQYEFAEPQPATFHQTAVWSLKGTISPQAKQRILDAAGERLPQHVPASVVMVLGQDDLFPFRIEFRREPNQDKTSVAQSIVDEVIVNAAEQPLLITETRSDSNSVLSTPRFVT